MKNTGVAKVEFTCDLMKEYVRFKRLVFLFYVENGHRFFSLASFGKVSLTKYYMLKSFVLLRQLTAIADILQNGFSLKKTPASALQFLPP